MRLLVVITLILSALNAAYATLAKGKLRAFSTFTAVFSGGAFIITVQYYFAHQHY